MHRWGTASPTHSVNITFNLTGSQTSAGADPIVYKPTISVIGGADAAANTTALITFVGTLTAGTGTTFTLVSAKARATNVRFRGTFGVTPTIEQLLQNTTHPSLAWNTGINNNVTQPMTTTSLSTNSFSTIGTEVDTWATSDAITPNTLPSFNFMDVEPVMAGLQGNGGIVITHVLVPENTAVGVQPGDDQFVVGSGVQLIENAFERQVVFAQPRINSIQSFTSINNAFASGAVTHPWNGSPYNGANDNVVMSVNAGYLYSQSTSLGGTGTIELSNTLLDYDVFLKTGSSQPMIARGANFAGLVDLEGKLLIQHGIFDATVTSASGNIVWGTGGTLDSGNGIVLYKSGAGGAAANIPVTNLRIGGGTTCILAVPSSVATPFTGNETVSAAAALDAILGATVGGCTDGIGGGFKNFGN